MKITTVNKEGFSMKKVTVLLITILMMAVSLVGAAAMTDTIQTVSFQIAAILCRKSWSQQIKKTLLSLMNQFMQASILSRVQKAWNIP